MQDSHRDSHEPSPSPPASPPSPPSSPPVSAPSRTRRRALTLGAFAVVVAGGLGLAAACGDSPGGGSGDAQRSEGPARSHHKPKPKPQRVWDRSPGSLAAVGDSISRGFDACSLLADCTQASWATGSDGEVDSLSQRLLKDPHGKSWNYAVSGAVMSGLPAQMRKAAAVDPDMVTVMSGANDACRPSVGAMTPVDDFRESFREAMRVLRSERPKTQVYVASVPDLKRLWQQGRQNPLGRSVWKLGICQSVLKDAEATDKASADRRQQVYDRVVAYNSVLKSECAKDLRCRYDNGAVFRYRFTTAELSHWDWFHPSKKGQHSLAEMAYREITSRRAGVR